MKRVNRRVDWVVIVNPILVNLSVLKTIIQHNVQLLIAIFLLFCELYAIWLDYHFDHSHLRG